MDISSLNQADFKKAYGILYSPFPSQNSRDGLYPSFCRVPPGDKTLLHSHFETEVFFIISGGGRMKVKNESREVGAGDLIRVPPFHPHELENPKNEELVFLSVYSEDFVVPSLPQKTLITAAPPTPNGSLHLGHISGPYLASDIVGRYLRLRGSNVHAHCGFDDHQNYVAEKAKSLGQDVEAFRARMHRRIQKSLETMDIRFDEFITPSHDEAYASRIQDFAQRALEAGIIERETRPMPFCSHCRQFLVDAGIEGECPSCQSSSRGGCETCGLVVPPWDVLRPRCSRCGNEALLETTTVHTFSLPKYLPLIREDLEKLSLTPRLRELVRQVLSNPPPSVLVSHPKAGADGIMMRDSDLVIHVWFEMAAHYENFATHSSHWTHCFGFDNGFYYLIFIPALLRAMNPAARLPDAIVANEFLLLEGEKFSTSRGHALWADEFTGNVDHLRLYLVAHRPSAGTSDFKSESFAEFSEKISKDMDLLLSRARGLASVKERESVAVVECNRITRDLERLLSPATLDLRAAGRRILQFMDETIQGAGEGDRLRIQTLATMIAPFMPGTARHISQALGLDSTPWLSDWARAL